MSVLKVPGYCGLITLLLYSHTHPDDYIIATKTGAVKGLKSVVENVTVYTYLGIPYAAPPVGKLRFREPQPVKPWIGVYEATKLTPPCWQHNVGPPFEWLPNGKQNFDEDCLHLNIWVPLNGKDFNKAVMVWIHGGAFYSGSGSLDLYDGKKLAAQGNVIVVTLNYRLAAIGFLYSGTLDAPGNMGLKDQLLALRWIKENIEYFGGDPNQITLFGESAGSISVSAHLTSPLARGLFDRAILQSGSIYHTIFTRSIPESITFSNELARILDCNKENQTLSSFPSHVIDCLRSVPASEIALADRKVANPFTISFLPMYGDDYLPKRPIDEINAGNFHDVPTLIGTVADEGSLFLGIFYPKLLETDRPVMTRNQAIQFLEMLHQIIINPPLNVIIDHYLLNASNLDDGVRIKGVYDIIGDFLLYCPSVFSSEIYSTHGLKVYHYNFNHRRLISPYRAWLGVPHLEDVPFVFGTHFVREPWLSSVDTDFSKRIMEAWTSFAKTGKPSSEQFGIKEWPLYQKDNPTAIDLNPYRSEIINPYKPACDIWKQNY